MRRTIFNYLFILFIFTGPALFSQGLSHDQIDSLVAQALQINPSVGIAVAVVKDGEVIHAKGYGKASIKSGKEVNKHTLFAIASNSKAFTTTALAMLVDEEKLSWNDKVIDHIPEFKMYDDYVTANFTVEDLLTHRSGLGLGAGDLMIFPDGGDFTIDDVLNSFQYQTPTSAFRTKYDYDNLLYLVGGEVVSRISGLSWVDFIQNRIFNPLGMDESVTSNLRLEKNANIALPHRSYGDEIIQFDTYNGGDLIGAAAGIYASVDDLSQWMLVHLNEGKYGKDLSSQLFSPERQREMWKPHTNTRFSYISNPRTSNHFSAYGLGWVISDMNGKIVAEHTGGLPGMLSRTVMVPELNLGIVVLTNSDPGGYGYYSITSSILEPFLDIPTRNWIRELSDRAISRGNESDSVTNMVWDKVKQNKNVPFDMNGITGTYQDDWFGEVIIHSTDDEIQIECKRSPRLKGTMHYYQATTFAVRWEYQDMPCDAFATFNFDEHGNAVGIKMKGISPNIDFSFDFHDLDLVKVN